MNRLAPFALALMIAMVLQLGALANPENAKAASQQVTAGSGLNLRSGPGFQYSVLTVIPYGSSVETGEVQSPWVQVTYIGISGWAWAGYLGNASVVPSSSPSSSDCVPAWGATVCAPADVAEAIRSAANYYGVDYSWLLRVAGCESNFQQSARGNAGEIGIFQFLPSTFYAHGGENIYSIWDQSYTAAWMFSRGLSWHWTCK